MIKKNFQLNQYLFSGFLVICTLALVVFFITCFRNMDYKSGLKGNAFYYFDLLGWLYISLGGLLLLFIGSIINTTVTIIKAIERKKLEWPKFILAVFPIMTVSVAYLFFSLSSSFQTRAGAWDFLSGYEIWVNENVDIPAIQEWLAALPADYSGQSFFEAADFPEALPQAITQLDPYHMNFSAFQDGQRSVMFEWGCALGHFGIVIGLPEMETPEDEELIKHTDYDFEYRRPIQSGVYIFNRG